MMLGPLEAGLLALGVTFAGAAFGFRMGRKRERRPDCPFPGECVTCNPATATASGTMHMKYTQWSPPFQTYPAAD